MPSSVFLNMNENPGIEEGEISDSATGRKGHSSFTFCLDSSGPCDTFVVAVNLNGHLFDFIISATK